MPKVSQAYLDNRRTEILDAAVVCFSRQGFHRATMLDIVRQSKLSPGAIYNYFGSKEEIIEAIASRRQARERRIMTEAMKQDSTAKALQRVRDVFFAELKDPQERRRRRVSIQLWGEGQRDPKILRVVRRSFEEPRNALCEILTEARRRGEIRADIDLDATARFLIALFHGLVLQAEWDEQFSAEPHIRLLDRFLEAISPPADPAAGRQPVISFRAI
jgi:AcrR family transcriptional regulator